MFVTSTDIAIVDREVSSRFLLMTPMPFRLLAVLKYRSISMRAVLSRVEILRFFLDSALSLAGEPSYHIIVEIARK